MVSGNYYTLLTYEGDSYFDSLWFELPFYDLEAFVMFRVRACDTARVALSAFHGNTNSQTYEIVIGGWGNTRTVLRRSVKGSIVAEAETIDIVHCDYFRSFWVYQSREVGGNIEIGSGSVLGEGVLLSWVDDNPYAVTSVSLSTGNGAKGEWEVLHIQSECEHGDLEQC